MEDVKLNELHAAIGDLEYPLSNADAQAAVSDVQLQYADGEEPLSDVISRTTAERFEDPMDLEAEIYNNLPIEAVGEPGQSEGEG